MTEDEYRATKAEVMRRAINLAEVLAEWMFKLVAEERAKNG
jgi:hypothetical protein